MNSIENNPFIYLKCVKEGRKLRIKIISQGFNNNANCRFPRNIREEGRIYKVSINNITMIQSKNSYFYSIKKPIIIVETTEHTDNIQNPITIYTDENDPDCIICLDNKKEKVLSCGHYCLCAACINKLIQPKKCPLCRALIQYTIFPSEMQ